MNNQRNSGTPLSSFDQDFGGQHFEPVEETVVIDGDIVARLVDRRRPGDPELAQLHRLLVVDPTGEEWEYAIDGEIMLGRAEDNHIALPDRAVSRHHLAVNTDGQLYWFQDLNSGNGTQVNGEFMKEGWLTGGEEIVIGNSHIYFLVPEIDVPPELARMDSAFDGAPQPAAPDGAQPADASATPEVVMVPPDEKSGGAGRLLAFLFLLLVLAGAGVAGWWIYHQIKSKPSAIAQGQDPQKQIRPVQEALELFDKGKELMRKQQWEKADELLRKAASMIPSTDPMQGNILQYANMVSRERIARHLYKQAEDLYNKDQVAKALTMLQRIPMTSKVFKDAEIFRERIYKKDLGQRMTVLRLQLESKRTVNAMKTLNEILQIAPQYQPALKIKQQLEAGEPTTFGKATPPPRQRARNPYGNSNTLPAQLQSGKLMFCQGQFAQAVIYFRQQESAASTAGLRTRAALFRQRVEDFERDLNAGLSAARRSRSAKSISKLNSAKKIDETYFGSCRSSDYKRKLSRMYYKRSRRNFRRRRYRRAARQIRKARKLNTKSKAIFKASGAIRGKAKRLINEAKVLIGIDNGEARNYLRKAMGMLPSNDPLYNQAKRYLSRAQ